MSRAIAQSKFEEQVNGAQVTIEGNTMTVVIPLDPVGHESSTGKSDILWNTGGWYKLSNGLRMNFGVIRKK